MSNPWLNRYRARWQVLASQAQAYWSGLALREKRLVSGMALGVSALFVWLVLIQPPLKKIDFWALETPRLRTQAQTLDSLLQGLAMPGVDGVEPGLRASLEASGLAGHYQLQGSAEGWLLTFDDAPADALVGWLLGNPRSFTLEVVEARLQRTGTTEPDGSAGRLSGTVRMDQARGAKEAS
ncbi:type II secretion system protein M [Pseudomonas gingeri]|uniref:type II secretion system protein GspM n=1 Tax=Pseudomonas gingeri TaxID=117681 RepID=UPI00159FE769|nr:type II secretion system protein GspM [Pseudomonas gingeri]NVZ24752.1 type II secretion system protein M [Pseudomonas gingeri]NWE45372.1 type II secretion system protein M [Pseudomonas gingeri]NWE72911.1 type II secretion system protein M [Pseudomonas gingeri]